MGRSPPLFLPVQMPLFFKMCYNKGRIKATHPNTRRSP